MKFSRYIALTLGLCTFSLLSSCKESNHQTENGTPLNTTVAPVDSKPAGLDQFSWMLGQWKQEEGEDQISYENWKRLDNGAYLGNACTLLKGDTVWQEVVDLYQEGNEIYMRVDQPQNPDPVAFRLARSTSNSASFENPEHDFPQQIFYERDSDTTMHARIGGAREGKYAAKDFYMVLVK